MNFHKPLHELSEEEILKGINNWDPKFAVLGQYELIRRISLESSKSSERFAKASFTLSVMALALSLALGYMQSIGVQNVKIVDKPLVENLN